MSERSIALAIGLGIHACAGAWMAQASAAEPVRAALDLPFEAQVKVVMAAGRVAGHEVAIAQFQSPLSVGEAVARSREGWRSDRTPVVEGQSGGWRTISRHLQRQIVTLQIREGRNGGSDGLVSVWARGGDSQAPVDLPIDQWLPSGSSRAIRADSADGGQRAATWVATYPGPIEPFWRSLVERLLAEGFTPSGGPELPARHRDLRAAAMRRTDGELVVTADGRGRHTGVVFYWLGARK